VAGRCLAAECCFEGYLLATKNILGSWLSLLFQFLHSRRADGPPLMLHV